MIVILAEEQNAALAHEIDDLWISFEDTETGEIFDFIGKSAGVINRTIYLQTVFLTDHKVVMAVARRRVYQACSGFVCR